MTQVNINNLSKIFISMDRPAVDNVNLEINNGELIALLGPSGCGKTTILKMITGIIHPDEGDILLDGESILSIPTEKRNIVMVFQNYLLFPYMTVNENVGFALKMKGIDNKEIEIKVKEMLELVKLPDVGNRKPKQLSGGQQQRVALARALIANPRLLLLDEPLSNLDAHLRDEMRELITSIQKTLNITCIFVTHDQEEAVLLADKIALIFDGKLQNFAQPKNFYENPINSKAAKFFGGVNFIKSKKNENYLNTSLGKIIYKKNNYKDLNENCLITIRPENIKILNEKNNSENVFKGLIESIIFSGTHTRYKIQINDQIIECTVQSIGIKNINIGDQILFKLPEEKIWAMNE